MHMIHELQYSNTNTYLIRGEKGSLLFDTGWAGTFPALCRAMGEIKVPVQEGFIFPDQGGGSPVLQNGGEPGLSYEARDPGRDSALPGAQ